MFYPQIQIKQIQNWVLNFPNLFDVSETTGNWWKHNISSVFKSMDFWAKNLFSRICWKEYSTGWRVQGLISYRGRSFFLS